MWSGGGRALRATAWLNVVVHVAGLALAVVFMRPGTPAAPLLDRLAYLAAPPAGWTAAWLVWMACAAALAAFLLLLGGTSSPAPLRAAALVAAIGAATDLVCDGVYIFGLPAHARGDVAAFLTFERGLTAASQTGANGLYTFAVLLATIGLDRSRLGARALGAITVAGGVVLAAAGLTGSTGAATAGTAIAIPAFLAWTLAVSSPAS